jgi:thiol-disulfide isomerase/thioredoxin
LKKFRFSALILLIVVAVGFLVFPLSAKESKDKEEFAPTINKDNPGVSIDITKHTVPGKITIFDFYSDFCPPCLSIAPRLEELDRSRTDLAVKKIDINRKGKAGIDWQSPLVGQYNINAVPFFIIYDEKGNLVASGSDASRKLWEYLSEMSAQK